MFRTVGLTGIVGDTGVLKDALGYTQVTWGEYSEEAGVKKLIEIICVNDK